MAASGKVDKLVEARKLETEGDKCAKKSFFHKPDWEGAASNYEKAANLFRTSKCHPDSKRLFEKAAAAQYQLDAVFTAGQCTEKAANEALEDKDTAEAGELLKKASQLYLEAQQPDKSAQTLSKAAKLIGAEDPDAAIALMMSALETYEAEDRERFSGEAYKATVALLIKAGRYMEAVALLERQIRIFKKLEQRESAYKNFLSIVVLYLQSGDYVAADRANGKFMSEDGYLATNELRAANEMLDAYDAGDQEALTNVTKKQVFTFLDQEVARVAKRLTVSGDGGRGGGGGGGGGGRFDDDAGPPPAEDPEGIL